MNQSSYVSQALWQYRVTSQFTDVTLVCEDSRLPAHAALLSGFLSSFGITLGEAPHLLLLPDMDCKEIEAPLREIYMDYSSKSLFEAFSLCDISKEGTDHLDIVEENSKEKAQISVVKEDIYDDPLENIFSNADFEEKHIDDLNTNALSVFSEKEAQLNKARKNRKVFDLRCKKCDIGFSEGKLKLEHRKQVHGYKYIPLEDRIERPHIPMGEKCLYCVKVVKTKYATSHMALRHREEALSNHPEIVQLFQVSCPDCSEMFLRDRLDFNKHAKEVHGKARTQYKIRNKCMVCNILFNNNRDLIRHRRKKHPAECLDMGIKTDVKKMQCPYCEKIIVNSNWSIHIFKKHREKCIFHPEIVAEHTCGICDEQFILKKHHTEHMRKLHTSPATCLLCSKVCPNELSLENHTYVIHKRAGSFVCEYCSKAFNNRRSLVEHLNCMHFGISSREFSTSANYVPLENTKQKKVYSNILAMFIQE